MQRIFFLIKRTRSWRDLNVYSTAVHQSQFTPSTIAETYTYSREMVLNKRSILTLRRNEISVSSDRTIFNTRLDNALSGNRYRRRWLCSTTHQRTSVLWSTDVPQANDLDMRIVARYDFAESSGNADAHFALGGGNHTPDIALDCLEISWRRRRSDSCPKHLEERLRTTSAPSQLNDNG